MTFFGSQLYGPSFAFQSIMLKPAALATTGTKHAVGTSGVDGSAVPLRPPPSKVVVWLPCSYTHRRVTWSPQALADCANSSQAAKLFSPSEAVFRPLGRYWSNSASYCGMAGTSVARKGVVASLM